MRILHILDHSLPLHSGYTFRTRNLLRGQHALGWHTAQLTGLKQGRVKALEEDVNGLHFYRTAGAGAFATRLPLINQWNVIRTLTERIVEVAALEKPDVLHAHSPALNGIAALRAGHRLRLPVVYECRAFWEDAAVDHGTSRQWGPRYHLTRAMENYVFRHVDAVTTICEGLRQDIAARGIAADKITVIPNAVDTVSFSRGTPLRHQLQHLHGLEGKTVLGFIGSFYAYEGIGLLLQSMAALIKEHPELRLLLVGSGPQQSHIENTIHRLGLSDVVVMIGPVAHEYVPNYYKLVDIFVYPRLPMRLTELVTPLKPLEAMAQGRLVLASDVGGHRELIRDGETGVLFSAGKPAALSAAISKLLLARNDWQRLLDNGRAFVEQERCWPASVERYRTVYGALL